MAVVILFSALSHLYSQSQSDQDWQLVETSNEIEIYIQAAECNDKPVYLFKLVNTSDVEKNFTLTIDILLEPAYGEYSITLTIPANVQSTQSCDDKTLKLPRMVPFTDELVSNIDVELTIN
jgi:hypothetical protein